MSQVSNTHPNPETDQDESDDRIIGVAFWWSLAVLAVAAAVGGGAYLVLSKRPPPAIVGARAVEKPMLQEIAADAAPTIRFTDVTQAAGIRFSRVNGAKGEKLLPETMGGGVAFFDFNNDGYPDLLFVNSKEWKDDSASAPPALVLYRNDGKGNFTDVTAEAGLTASFYGMGVACGDYDGDGWVDLFVTAVGKNHLFHNEQGKFVETTEQAGVGGTADQWSTSAAFVDIDGDGRLDLFVGNYIAWTRDLDEKQGFTLKGGQRAYGPPFAFGGSFPYLYHNDGNGKFSDISESAGVRVRNRDTKAAVAKTMGVVPVDYDGDGKVDLIVANDTVQNFVFHNLGNNRFEEVGETTNVAFDPNGNARGAMGIDAGFFRNDHCLGVAIGNFSGQMMGLYTSDTDPSVFSDAANATGLGPQTRAELTFGVLFLDADLDGRLDLLAANGHLEEEIARVDTSQTYRQAPQLFWNAGRYTASESRKAEFVKLSAAQVGDDFSQPLVGRGAAVADIDGDGDLDVVICQPQGPPRLLRNDQKLGHHWLRVRLKSDGLNRDALGGWVEVKSAGMTQRRHVMPSRSYLSQVELPVTFGLGKSAVPVQLKIRWPDGAQQELQDVTPDQFLTITQPTKGKAE